MGRLRSESQPQQPACLSRTASSPSPSSETNFSAGPAWPPPPGLVIPKPTTAEPTFFQNNNPIADQTSSKTNTNHSSRNKQIYPNLDLQLSTATANVDIARDDTHSTQLQLSIGSSTDMSDKNESNIRNSSPKESSNSSDKPPGAATAALRVEKAYAEEVRKEAKRQMEAAEQEFANARRIRQQAQAELDKAYALKERAIKQINATMLQITCQACKQQFQQQAHKLIKEGGQVLDNNNNVKDHHQSH